MNPIEIIKNIIFSTWKLNLLDHGFSKFIMLLDDTWLQCETVSKSICVNNYN